MWSAASAHADPSKQECVDAALEGQKQRDEGHWLSARERFARCTSSSCPTVVREDCGHWQTEIAEKIPTIVLGARTADGNERVDVTVLVDGKPFFSRLDGLPKPIDPGAHRIELATQDGLRAEANLVFRVGEPGRVFVATLMVSASGEVARVPARTTVESPSVLPMVVTGGLTLLGAAATIAFALSADSKRDQLRGECAPTCTDDRTSSVRTSLALANVSLVTSILAGSAFTFFTIKYLGDRSRVQITPSVSTTSLGGSVMLRY